LVVEGIEEADKKEAVVAVQPPSVRSGPLVKLIHHCHVPRCLHHRGIVPPLLAPGADLGVRVFVGNDDIHLDQIVRLEEINERLDGWAAGDDVFVGPGVAEDVRLVFDEGMTTVSYGEESNE
jgi:hypothetical protein